MLIDQARLERGSFIWPKAESGTVRLSRAQLSHGEERKVWGDGGYQGQTEAI